MITKEQKHLAFECILLHEVVTKRVAALGDKRKALGKVKVYGASVLSPELQERVFPVDKGVTNARMIRSCMKYNRQGCTDRLCLQDQMLFEHLH